MNAYTALFSKELRGQLPWLAFWALVANLPSALLVWGLVLEQFIPVTGEDPVALSWEGVGASVENLSGLSLAVPYALLFLVGFAFFVGGYRSFRREIDERTFVWLRSVPWSDAVGGGIKMGAGALYLLLASLSAQLVRWVAGLAFGASGMRPWYYLGRFLAEGAAVAVVLLPWYLLGTLVALYTRHGHGWRVLLVSGAAWGVAFAVLSTATLIGGGLVHAPGLRTSLSLVLAAVLGWTSIRVYRRRDVVA